MIAETLVALTASLTPVPLQAFARDTTEPVIVELGLGRLASRTVAAFRVGPEALLPVGELFDLAEIRIERVTDSVIEATLYPDRRRLVLDAVAHTLTVGGEREALTADDLVADRGELYLAAAVLGRALHLDWNVSWPDLAVVAVDPSRLPLAERITRDWQRRTRAAGDHPSLPDRALGFNRPALDGVVLDYSVLAPSGRPFAEGAYSTGVGLDVLGGSFTARVQNQGAAGAQRVRTDVSWHGVFPAARWLTQARLGDGYSTGPSTRTVRGFAISNAPYLRPSLIGDIAFAGELGPGWQVEAYRGGRFIGFDSVNALGRFSIDAPIQYGENPIDFVAYGPFGEVRRFNRNFRVDGDRLRGGALEYGVSAGQCRSTLCTGTANMDLRYGLSPRWTARVGVDRFWRGSQSDLFHPYAALIGSLTNAVSVQGEAVANAVLRAAVRYDPSTALSLSVEASRFARGVIDPILTVDGRTSQLTASAFYRPFGSASGTFVEASLDRIRTVDGTSTSGGLGGSWQRGDVQLLPALRWRREQRGGVVTRRVTVGINAFALRLPGPATLRNLTGRIAAEAQASLAPETLVGFVGRNVGRHLRVEMGGGWRRGQGATAVVTVAANLPTMRSTTTATRVSGRTTASQLIQGSILYDPARRSVRLGSGPSLDRGGVSGRVFLDINANELLDPGEPLLPRVRLSIGRETRTSDASGRYDLWNVTPHEAAIVAVDSTSLASPLWVPAYRAVEIRPGPNRYEVLDIPVLPGGMIEGTVLRAADSIALGGVSLQLERVGNPGKRIVVSFRDGEFYAIGIKPGDYLLGLEPEAASRRGLSAEPVRFTVPPDVDGATISGLVIRVR